MAAFYFGFNMPFLDNRGVLARQEDARLIKNDILQLLLTIPGERVHRPKFGTILRTSVFDPLTDATISQLQQSVKTAIINNEPRLNNPEVSITVDKDKSQVNVKVVGDLNYDSNERLEIIASIDAPGARL